MMRARLFLALRALIAVWCLIGLDPAWAGTPGPDTLLFGRPGWVLPGASADMNFATSQYFGLSLGQIAVSRASNEYEICNGQLFGPFPPNVLAITPGCGAWVWEPRTNSNPNSTMTGVVPGVLGSGGAMPTGWVFFGVAGVTTTISNVQNVNGIPTVSFTFAGTPSVTGSVFIQPTTSNNVAALYGQIWSHSIYASISNQTNVSNMYSVAFWSNSGSTYIAGTYAAALVTTTLSKFAANDFVFQPTAAYIMQIFQFDFTLNQPVNFTLTLALPQLELNPNLPASVASAASPVGGTGWGTGTGVIQNTFGGNCATPIQLNVTAAAGAITLVNSVANAGSCAAATGLPPTGNTAWTYVSGTISAGSGASFTLTPVNNSAQGFATGPILTSSGAVTRAATNATGPLPSCSNPSVYVAGTPAAPTTYPVTQFAALVDDGGTTNLVKMIRAANTGQPVVGTKTQVVTVSGGPWAQSGAGKLTESIGGGNVNGRFSGGAVSTAAATSPPALNRLQIGSQNGASSFNGVIARLAVACNGPSLLNN